jgi:hypothetical protein
VMCCGLVPKKKKGTSNTRCRDHLRLAASRGLKCDSESDNVLLLPSTKNITLDTLMWRQD